MGEYSRDELIQVQSDIKIYEKKLSKIINEYNFQRTEVSKVIGNLKALLKENCIDGSGKHEWQPLMFYDYVCKKCEVIK
jgi:hypothetical protein